MIKTQIKNSMKYERKCNTIKQHEILVYF